uniref:TFIIS N-terminal domain-containing protein n=1 Tax=Anopheles dirus TaxID=7168 RepID=A0A182MXQ8_9DIPT
MSSGSKKAPPPPAEQNDFEIMLEQKKKKAPWWDSEEARRDCARNVESVLRRMRKAARHDDASRRKGKQAIQKMVQLKSFSAELCKTFQHRELLDQGVLTVIARWLAPTADNRLCPLEIRQTLLKSLLDMPSIDRCHLRESGVAKVLLKLRAHPEETCANKRRATELIDRWARMVYRIPTEPLQLTRRDWRTLQKKRGMTVAPNN